MVYIPTEWFSGDTITAEKLNHIEEGVRSIVHPYSREYYNSFSTSGFHGPIMTVNDNGDEFGPTIHYATLEEIIDRDHPINTLLVTNNSGIINHLPFSEFMETYFSMKSVDSPEDTRTLKVMVYDESSKESFILSFGEFANLIASYLNIPDTSVSAE